MTSITNAMKLKFKIGQKVYYKFQEKYLSATIKKIDITVSIKENKEEHSVQYTIAAQCLRNYGWSFSSQYGKRNRKFKEDKLFESQDDFRAELKLANNKKTNTAISDAKKKIALYKKTIRLENKKLAEIKKEELIEKLSGI